MFWQKFLTVTLLVVILFSQSIPRTSAGGIPQQHSLGQVCDWAKFIADVTVTDGAYFPAGAQLIKEAKEHGQFGRAHVPEAGAEDSAAEQGE